MYQYFLFQNIFFSFGFFNNFEYNFSILINQKIILTVIIKNLLRFCDNLSQF